MENKEHALLIEGFHTEVDYIDQLYKTGHVIELAEGQYFMRWKRKCISTTGQLAHARYFGTEQEAAAFVYKSLCYIDLNPFVCKVSWFLVSYEQKDNREQYWSGKEYIPDIHMAIPKEINKFMENLGGYIKMKKFQDVNVLEVLKGIMETNTAHYQSDFEIDISILKKAAESKNHADKTWLWMSRPSGTWCLRERDTFLKGTREYNTWKFYGEQTGDKILAYAVELQENKQGRLFGNLYQLEYQKHFQHVKDTVQPKGTVTLTYEHGNREQADISYIPLYDKQLGKFQRYEYQPENPELFQLILQKENDNRLRFSLDDINLHIKKLGSGQSGKE